MMEPQIVPFSAKSFQIYSWQTAGWRKALKAFSNPSLCWYLHISLKKQAIRLWIFNIKVNFAIELKASKCLTIDTEKSLSSIDFVLLGSGERWSRGIPHDAGRQQVWWGGRQEETILFMTMMTFIMFRQAGSVRKDRRGFAGNKEKTNENQIGKKNVVKCCSPAENVEMQVHRNFGQARHEHQRAVWGAVEDGDEEDVVSAADRGHGEEEEEVLPHVIQGNEHSSLLFTHQNTQHIHHLTIFWFALTFSNKFYWTKVATLMSPLKAIERA